MDTVIKKLTIPSLLLLALLLGMGLEVLSHPPKSSTAISEIRNLSTFKSERISRGRLLKETNEKKGFVMDLGTDRAHSSIDKEPKR